MTLPPYSPSGLPTRFTSLPAGTNELIVPVDDIRAGENESKGLPVNVLLENTTTPREVATVAALRALDASGLADGIVYDVVGHTVAGKGSGKFILNKSGTAGANLDDNGVRIHAAGGPPVTDPMAWYWDRDFNGQRVNPEWFGAIHDGDVNTGSGTDDSAAVQAFFDFQGSPAGGDISWPLKGHVPSGQYRIDSPLNFNTAATKFGSIDGDGQQNTLFFAGAAIPYILKVGDIVAANSAFNDMNGVSFRGRELADTCLIADSSSYTYYRNCSFGGAINEEVQMGEFIVHWISCQFTSLNNAGSGPTGADSVRILSTTASNGNFFENCDFRWSRIAIHSKVQSRGLWIRECSFDQHVAALFLESGCDHCTFENNILERVGNQQNVDAGILVEVSEGNSETWYGAIIATSNFNNPTFTSIRHLVVRNNLFLNCSNNGLCSLRWINNFIWEENQMEDRDFVSAVIHLHKEAANQSIVEQMRVEMSGATFAASINSADSGSNTITISVGWDIETNVPCRVLGGSLPAGLNDGEIVFLRDRGIGQTAFELSRTVGGPFIPIGGTGTGTIRRLSPWAQLFDISNVTNPSNPVDTVCGIQARTHSESIQTRTPLGTRSLGGSPGTWTEVGTATWTIDPGLYDGFEPIYKLEGAGHRAFTITPQNQTTGNKEKEGIRGSYLRVSGLSRGDGGAGGVRISFWVQPVGGTLTEIWFKAINATDWDEIPHTLAYVPWDAEVVEFRLAQNGALPALLTRFSICDAGRAVQDSPIAV